MVYDQYAPLADKIQAVLKGITDRPVRFVINTHYHEDHTGGNEFFQKQAPIIAHDNVLNRINTHVLFHDFEPLEAGSRNPDFPGKLTESLVAAACF